MSEWEVTGPDGRVYTVTAPEGATEQDVLGYAERNLGAAPPTTPEDDKDLSGNWFGRKFGAPIARG